VIPAHVGWFAWDVSKAAVDRDVFDYHPVIAWTHEDGLLYAFTATGYVWPIDPRAAFGYEAAYLPSISRLQALESGKGELYSTPLRVPK
jgi:hypothetical protein